MAEGDAVQDAGGAPAPLVDTEAVSEVAPGVHVISDGRVPLVPADAIVGAMEAPLFPYMAFARHEAHGVRYALYQSGMPGADPSLIGCSPDQLEYAGKSALPSLQEAESPCAAVLPPTNAVSSSGPRSSSPPLIYSPRGPACTFGVSFHRMRARSPLPAPRPVRRSRQAGSLQCLAFPHVEPCMRLDAAKATGVIRRRKHGQRHRGQWNPGLELREHPELGGNLRK